MKIGKNLVLIRTWHWPLGANGYSFALSGNYHFYSIGIVTDSFIVEPVANNKKSQQTVSNLGRDLVGHKPAGQLKMF